MSLPLRIDARMTLPAPSSRFDFADVDPSTHRLFLGQLGASRLLEIAPTTQRVVHITTGLSDVHGVIVVPALHRVFATATGTNQLVAPDETTGAELFRTKTGQYPDGLTYVRSTLVVLSCRRCHPKPASRSAQHIAPRITVEHRAWTRARD
jgi:hypothetical protein